MRTIPAPPAPSTFIAESGLEIKVCIGSYKLFFVPDTEDFFSRRLTVEDEENRRALVESGSKEGGEKVEKWVEEKLGLAGPAEAVEEKKEEPVGGAPAPAAVEAAVAEAAAPAPPVTPVA